VEGSVPRRQEVLPQGLPDGPAEALEEDDTEGVEIRPVVRRPPPEDLRREVPRGPGGRRPRPPATELLGQAEVEDADLVALPARRTAPPCEDVPRLDVPVAPAGRVDGVEGSEEVRRDGGQAAGLPGGTQGAAGHDVRKEVRDAGEIRALPEDPGLDGSDHERVAHPPPRGELPQEGGLRRRPIAALPGRRRGPPLFREEKDLEGEGRSRPERVLDAVDRAEAPPPQEGDRAEAAERGERGRLRGGNRRRGGRSGRSASGTHVGPYLIENRSFINRFPDKEPFTTIDETT